MFMVLHQPSTNRPGIFMANLEKIINELPQLVVSLKLNLSNVDELNQQVVHINNIQMQLLYLQTIINEELKLAKLNNLSIHSLPPIGTTASLLLDDISLGETATPAQSKYITAKFGNPNTEISIHDLQAKIDYWIEWGDFLRVVAADIVNDSQLVSQLNSHSHHPNLAATLAKVSEILKINLALSNREILSQQLQQLRNSQTEVLQVKQKLNHVINAINKNPNFLNILINITSFYGASGLILEWLDDDQELIISSDGKFHELTDIVNECQKLQQTVDILTFNINNLTKQAEEYMRYLSPAIQPPKFINRRRKLTPRWRFTNIFHPIIIGVASLLLIISTGWLINRTITSQQPTLLNSRQEATAVANFQSALKLGLEASALVENPPYPVTVWQQAETKWLQAIELLESVPPRSSVYQEASGRLFRYRRNRMAISQKVLDEKQALADLQTAQKLAMQARFFMQNSPNSLLALQEAKEKWEQAIDLLENIPQSTTFYEQAQQLLPIYRNSYAGINIILRN
jgi:tetrahydromethanopterin S-methyltransferase subunit B